jgi:hypothetical protein
MRSLVILPVMTVMALVQWGCAVARPRTVAPPSAETQAQLGVIGVASAPEAPKMDLDRPMRGGGAVRGALAEAKTGAKAGAAPGVVIMLVGGYFMSVPIVGVPLIAAGGALTAGGAAVGAIVGALDGAVHGAASAKSVSREAETAIKNAVAELALPEALRQRVSEMAKERTSLTFVALPAERTLADLGDGPGAPEIILEVALQRIELTREGWEINAPVGLVTVARARLIRAADGHELYRHAVTHRTATQPFAEWAANDAHEFRGALTRASVSIAAELVEVLFDRRASKEGSAKEATWRGRR